MSSLSPAIPPTHPRCHFDYALAPATELAGQCSTGRTEEWCASALTLRAAWWLSVTGAASVCGRVPS